MRKGVEVSVPLISRKAQAVAVRSVAGFSYKIARLRWADATAVMNSQT